jgi:non-specific protein-tyrosine kinase
VKLAGLKLRYSQLQQALAQIVLNEAQVADPLRIVRTAQPGKQSVSPNSQLNIQAGVLAGLFLGFIVAALWELLDTRVRTADALVQLLQWPILATIWHVHVDDKRELLNPGANDLNVESYRMLRTNLGFASLDKPLRSLMVTSALPEEGKSLVAANLAIFMAKAGKNTLLIDADLRQPMLHRLFDLAPEKLGLSNALHSGSGVRSALFSLDSFVHSVNIPNLRVMPSGPLPPNPSELLDSKALQRFFLALSGCGAEVIIFDTPSASALSDASILASRVDGTIVVVDATCAKRDQLKQVKTVLTQAGATVVGCVVNKQHLTRQDAVYIYTEDSPRPSLVSILGLRK